MMWIRTEKLGEVNVGEVQGIGGVPGRELIPGAPPKIAGKEIQQTAVGAVKSGKSIAVPRSIGPGEEKMLETYRAQLQTIQAMFASLVQELESKGPAAMTKVANKMATTRLDADTVETIYKQLPAEAKSALAATMIFVNDKTSSAQRKELLELFQDTPLGAWMLKQPKIKE